MTSRAQRAERSLRKMSQRAEGSLGLLQALVANTGDAVFVVDTERNFVAFNERAEALTGMRRGEVLGRNCLTGFKCGTCLASCGVFEHGKVSNVPVEIFRKDGSRLEVFKNASVVRDRAGVVIGAVETFRLRDQVASPGDGALWPGVERSMEALGRGLLVLDDAFVVRRVSKVLEDLVGRPEAELLGQPAAMLLGQRLFDADSFFRTALEAGERREGWRASLRSSDGREQAVSVTGAPLQSDSSPEPGLRYLVVVRPEPQLTPIHGARGPVHFEGMVARSPSMLRVFQLIEHLRESDATVLITGESGTGKELVARAIHERSHHAGRPFVAVNCGALPEHLLETELFGHARGAFTGAIRDKIGRFEAAGDGTVFLDEIGDLPLPLQVKLLRVLQERTFERVGETQSRPFRARVVAATHQNLARAVSEKRFREDLFYRLNVVPLALPPLRERREDIEALALHLLERAGQRHRALRLSPSAMRAFLSYSWPGNVRQMENALEYATAVCEGQTIHPEDLPGEIVEGPGPARLEPLPSTSEPVQLSANADALGAWPTEERILDALAKTRHRRAAAAQLLGVSRTTLWRRLKELGYD
ncbi:MAG: sigma 54-interacting transcriptional regulator [Polyangiaceae bacterium]